MEGGSFAVDVSARGPVTVVRVVGDIDMFTAPRLRDELAAAQADGAGQVAVDLTDVAFLDSSALGALVSAHRELADAGRTLTLVAPQPNVRRVLEITRLSQVIPVLDSLDPGAG